MNIGLNLLILPLVLCITNSAIAEPTTGNPNTTILRPNHISCIDEHDVETLASIREEIDLHATIIGFITKGLCARESIPTKVVDLTKKTGSSGATYYCYHRIDYEIEDSNPIEVVAPAIECNISQSITTLKNLVTERTGDFKVVGSGPFGATAICSEGGRVSLRFEGKKVFRTAHVLPGAFKKDALAEPKIEVAFRNGCKGLDAIQ